jgi:hypothetical protein
VSTVIGGRPRRQLDAIHPVEHPEDIQVRKPLDVGETDFESPLDLQDPFRTMLGAGALRNL